MGTPRTRLSTSRAADLALLLTLAALVAWYAHDAIGASTHWSNLIFVLPVAGVALVLCALECASHIAGRSSPVVRAQPAKNAAPLVGLFAGYVLSLNWRGFDVGTCAFITLHLRFFGQRRWHWALAYGLAVAALLSAFFS